jgi:DNA-binding LacI/PurR family transcriptional regulator
MSDYLVRAFARRIVDAAWQPGQRIPPARLLAELFGVARATIDGAVKEAVRLGLLRTRPRCATQVAPQGVANAAQLLHHRKRRSAARIAILTADTPDAERPDYHDRIVAHLERQARRSGWHAVPVYWPITRRGNFPRLLIDRGFDGAFCLATEPEYLMPLYFMRQTSFPVVVYNHRFPKLPLPTVLFDEYGAVQALGKLLHDLGHRRITLLAATGPGHQLDGLQLNGWRDFCRQYDLTDHWDEPLYLVGERDGARVLRAYFRRRPRPTAVILGTATLARAFAELGHPGLRVPEDLSVVAAHCSPDAAHSPTRPAITGMNVNLERIAECSLELLARMIEGEPYPPPLRLPYTLERTESIGPPPKDRAGEAARDNTPR